MDELEHLKKDWEKPKDEFKEYSEEEIYSMIHKKSMNVAKKLIFIAILEILFFNGFIYLLSKIFPIDVDVPELKGLKKFVVEYLYYIVVVVFLIFLLFFNKIIKDAHRPQQLKKVLFYIRRFVYGYMILVFFIHSISFIMGFYDGLTQNRFKEHGILDWIFAWTVCFVILAIPLVIFYFIYVKFIYKKILEAFKINYSDLVKLEESQQKSN